MAFLITFILLSIFNVIFSTVKSILTVKGSKLVASVISGSYYAFYNIMIIYTVIDFPMWQKCLITFVANVIGVYVVKWFEEKVEKDKLWKVEATINHEYESQVCEVLNMVDIPYNYIQGIGKYTIFNVFCSTRAQSESVKRLLSKYDAKYFVAESKTL